MSYIQLQFRRDTSVNWAAKNPLLACGEMGIELDNHVFKIGDGILRWNDLPYGGLQGPTGPPGLIPPSATVPGQVLTYIGPNQSDISWQEPSLTYQNTAIIKIPKIDTGFDFSNVLNNFVILPSSFGSSYTPGSIPRSGFSILLNSNYNMVYFPNIMGTLAYWDPIKLCMTYMQIKFGNSSTSNAVRARITPGNLSAVDNHGIHTYGAPLLLTIDGITEVAFNSAGNISSSINPLKYAIVIFLKLMN